MPTLIVTGGKDFSVSKAAGLKMHHAAPRASFINLPGEGEEKGDE